MIQPLHLAHRIVNARLCDGFIHDISGNHVHISEFLAFGKVCYGLCWCLRMRLFQKVFTRNTRRILDIFDKCVADNDGVLVVGQSANGSEHCAICICVELFTLV